MAHEILSIKLCELEDQIIRLLHRIRLSETIDQVQLEREIKALKQECEENELTMEEKLQLSRAEIVSVIAQTYAEMQQALQKNNDALRDRDSRSLDSDAKSEERILLAEYALDFAVQAANRALLLSLEAIAVQSILQKEGMRQS